jgi:predicted kinase
MRTLILVRGLPGAGKSTFAKTLGGIHIEADHYFMKDGEYKFDASKLKQAHEHCRTSTEGWMMEGYVLGNIVVSNTFTQEWEMDDYYELAKKYGYRVVCLIVENRHGGVNEHGVPADKLEQMKNRFEIKL